MKQEKRFIIGLLTVANITGFVALGTTAAAEPAQKLNYAQVKVGVLQPTSGFNDAGYDTGFMGAISYGRYLSRNLILEGAIDSSAANSDTWGRNDSIGTYHLKNDLWITSFLLTLKGEVPVGPVNLYGGGGVGVYVVSLSSKVESDGSGDLKIDDSDTVFGAHLVAGANYDITKDFFVGVEGTYRWTGEADIQERAVDIPVVYKDNLDGFTVAATFGYRF
jgi:opacity protein-like surface antigen